jgi:Flp pilus assembly protein TadB
VTVASESGVQDNRGNPSKRFWSLFLAFWVVLGVVSLIAQLWWTAVAAAFGIINAVVQRRKAPDQPR